MTACGSCFLFDYLNGLRYGLDDRPPVGDTALFALQWLAMSLPFVVIIGTVAAGHHFADPGLRTLYLQKATFITGLMFLGQALFGHRLTLVAGPATALLLEIVGTRTTPDAVYTAIAICGILMALVSAAGLLLIASFSPVVLGVAGAIPPAVVGGMPVYTLSGQVAAGLTAAFVGGTFTFEDGLVIGLPLLAGTVTAILPPAAVAEFPATFRSVAGNGFVVGVVAVLILDRLFHRREE